MASHPRSRGILDPSLEKPLIALQAAMTSDALIKAVSTLVPRAVSCDFLDVFLRIEPHAYGAVAYRMIDSHGRDFSAQLIDGSFFQDHPTMPILMANPGIRFINTRGTLPPDAILHASRFYREVMQVIGFRHAVGMYFWSDPPVMPPEVVFAPCRVEGQPDFVEEEVALLDQLYPHIDAALRRVRATEQERAVRSELHSLIDPTRPACVLHWDLTAAEENRAAREMCAQWNFGAAPVSARLKPPPFCLPAPLRDACDQLKKRWSASLQRRPTTGTAERLAVRHPDHPSFGATVSMHVHHTDPLGKPALLIEFEPPENGARLTRRTKGDRVLGNFTLRERELIRLISEGKSNQEIATETSKALGSVKNALHGIFRKAGVSSRSALIAQVGGGSHNLPRLSSSFYAASAFQRSKV